MPEQNQTAGTPGTDDRDAQVTATTGTPEPDDRDAGPKPEDIAKLNLEWKDELSRTRAELDALKTRLEQAPAAQGKDEDDDEALLRAVADFAAKRDPVAQDHLRLRRELDDLKSGIAHVNQIRDLPMDRRQRVYDHFQKNRHRFGDPLAADADLKSQELAVENEKLRKDLLAATKKNDPDVVRTDVREVPASEHKIRKMTEAEFDRIQADLRAQNRHREAMAMQLELRNDRIELTG